MTENEPITSDFPDELYTQHIWIAYSCVFFDVHCQFFTTCTQKYTGIGYWKGVRYRVRYEKPRSFVYFDPPCIDDVAGNMRSAQQYTERATEIHFWISNLLQASLLPHLQALVVSDCRRRSNNNDYTRSDSSTQHFTSTSRFYQRESIWQTL